MGNLMTGRTFSTRSLHGRIAHHLGMRIVQGHYAEGDVFPSEEVFSAQLGISRTALREGIKVLAAKRLVDSRPKTGTRVRPRSEWSHLDPDVLAWQFASRPTREFVRSVYEIREMFETTAVTYAAQRRTADDIAAMEDAFAGMEAATPGEHFEPDLKFHRAILAATHNELLSDFGSLIDTVMAGGIKLTEKGGHPYSDALAEHKAVMDAIVAADADAAVAAIRVLLRNAEQVVYNALDRMPAGTAEPLPPFSVAKN